MVVLKKTIFLIFLLSTFIIGSEKRVLVELFTNSHCSLCPAAYSAMDNFLQSPNGSKIEYIYYHMSFPYSDDPLYQHNESDSDAKNSFYGPHSSTPKAYFNGILVSNSYSNWGPTLNDLIKETSPFEIQLSCELVDGSLSINAAVTKISDILDEQSTTINFVVVEDVFYTGRNGISDHKNVMRKIINPEGDLFEIDINETKDLSSSTSVSDEWEIENIRILVFIQNKNTKEVYQTISLHSSEFGLTNIKIENGLSNSFSLSQNYPNPFNPSTTINYSLPSDLAGRFNGGLEVELKVYDILGKEIATIIDQRQEPGNYSVNFDADNLSSGFYYYQLKAGDFVKTRKMIFIK